MIRLGPAGIPGACKQGSTLEGVRCVSDLGLNALEIEFVRSVYLTESSSREIGELARKLDVSLSCHAPYYINLASAESSVVAKSRKYIADTLFQADAMGASIAVVHAGFYMDRTARETYEIIKSSALEFRQFRAKFGIETMGRQKQFGSVDEVAQLTEECENVAPVIDFAHIHARTNGGLMTKDDFKKILDRFDNLGVSPMHCHMTGIKHENGNEKHHLTISSGEPDFRLLAQVLKENGYNVTIISESPVLEQDALLFKRWL